jgi:hypothetical protein
VKLTTHLHLKMGGAIHHRVQTGSGAHAVSYPVGTRGSFSDVKRVGREADHSPLSNTEVKNAWSYNSSPHYAFMDLCSVKAQELYLHSSIRLHSMVLC